MPLSDTTTKDALDTLTLLEEEYRTGAYRKNPSMFIRKLVKVYKMIVGEFDPSNKVNITSVINKLKDRDYKVEPIDNLFLQDLIRFLYTDEDVSFTKYIVVGPATKRVPIKIVYPKTNKAYTKIYSELDYIFSKGGTETALLIAKFLFKVFADDQN
jgi:hypothetical protein